MNSHQRKKYRKKMNAQGKYLLNSRDECNAHLMNNVLYKMGLSDEKSLKYWWRVAYENIPMEEHAITIEDIDSAMRNIVFK